MSFSTPPDAGRANTCPCSGPASAYGKWNNPKGHPWTIAWGQMYRADARTYALYILRELPRAKTGILYTSLGTSLGEVQWRCGTHGMARETLAGGLELAQRHGMKWLAGLSHRLLGEVSASEQLDAEAAAHFEQSIAIFGGIGSGNELALAYAGYGQLHKRAGRLADARESLTRALEIFERLGTLTEPDRVRAEVRELPAG